MNTCLEVHHIDVRVHPLQGLQFVQRDYSTTRSTLSKALIRASFIPFGLIGFVVFMTTVASGYEMVIGKATRKHAFAYL